MNQKSIEYKSIIMRCDKINHDAYRGLPENVEIEFYKNGMEETWKDIQKNAGEFSSKTDEEIIHYFLERFGNKKFLLEKQCFFLKDHNTQNYIGTCMAWETVKNNQTIPILHWLAVSDAFSRQGFARILITQVLKIFEKSYPAASIYLHTQPSSYAAIKLYHDFGFHICRKDTYGTAVNEYEEAIEILKTVMIPKEFEKITEDSVQ